MKKLFLLFVLGLFIFLSCDLLTYDEIMNWDYINMDRVPSYVVDMNTIIEFVYGESVMRLGHFPTLKYDYNKEEAIKNFTTRQIYLLPEETLKIGKGVCVDQSALMLALIHKILHKKGQLIVYHVKDTCAVYHTYVFIVDIIIIFLKI
jgi:hypothetical protein